jgi:CheY-like chemotaxis protein
VAWLKGKPDYRDIPVIVLTGAPSDEEVVAAKEKGALEAIPKPARFEELKAVLADLAVKLHF